MYQKYGSPENLRLTDIDIPVPKDHEVLVKVHAASVNYGNLVLLKGKPYLARFAYGLLKPKHTIPGGDIAGQVEAVGKDVTQFQPGDNVFGDLSGCGWGGFAEYVSVPEKGLAIKPANISFEEAAAVPMAGVTALQALRNKGNIQAGQKVLIYGASGGVGTFAVQIAKSFGAEVTGICSTRNLDILHTLGADHAIDYKKEDFSKRTEKYDLILAVNGYQPISAYKRALKSNGTYVLAGGSGAQFTQAMVLGPWISLTGNKKMSSMLQRQNQEDLFYLSELLEAGKVKSVIDRSFKLSEAEKAFRYFEEGHAQGKVIITIV
ncbi:NAD(P)-dependent alcohol dehydrogenase [Cytobacillus oceanisediminis]|uniref:Alcohol dehydrogenase n=1 Tax=Cytobacillus oceanisediminis 2691 TaxID=1196031 RepID=A0A160MC52_9BACI|nr:NAD(P)-dependent alcohol dehydrogenase [Cytobacillus oceanisediminis]AND40517.1 alcohol dehydrogenase [Cytobacillus oceanisediminis 2691]MCM3400989.1 NAD(P)-dependent alcohol dehydrogenase [Cytobacillus oceanisediminis]MDK7666271.1 NAD(P)-dependent alcohol dehydrogenase [Cytobacillus oceanisediminis]